ncbi:unnamed protein product [Adineta steineri]|uniref:Uncharacterized protein n=1 Tax=Adineta steineri TaxID=433720 RepID=A0A815FMB9_9BILA|nr:unnamed protein product [Adineta steineri]CAF1586960.1 unnamed protein product [Adineta steineri]
MSCTISCDYLPWKNAVHTPLVEWQKVLSKLTKREINRRLFAKVDLNHKPLQREHSAPTKKLLLSKNDDIDDTFIPSFLISPPSNVAQSSTDLSSTRRYASSFKTIGNEQIQRSNSTTTDNVVILKLTKDNTKEHIDNSSQSSRKHSLLSMGTSTTASSTPSAQQSSSSCSFSSSSPMRPNSILRTDGLKRHATHYDSPIIASSNTYLPISSGIALRMATSTTSHPSSNSSLFAYGNTITGGSTVRQRALADTTTNSLLITTERFKTNTSSSSSMRPARQPAMSSAYMTSQQLQRNASQTTRPRIQHDKTTISKDLYEYPDPFTNCPSDMLSKLAQLSKLQIETVEWEKKRRFTKKKSGANGTTQGKDSP